MCVRTVPEECLFRDLVLRNEETHDVKEMWTRHHVVQNRASQTDQLQVQGSGFRVEGLRASQCLMQGTAREGCCTEWKSQGKIHKFTKILADLYHRTPAKDTTEWCVKQVHSQSPSFCKRPSSSSTFSKPQVLQEALELDLPPTHASKAPPRT